MSEAPLPIAPGEILCGKYRIDSVLGRGGMGIVLAATHIQLDQRVAIKFLVAGGLDATMRERFAREARAVSKIQSEHVARVTDVGILDSGIPYTVMEYLAGEDLAKTLRTRGPLPMAEAVTYILQACEALAEAHRAGIVHRDLKPANLFLARRADGSTRVKLLDFGISKFAAGSADGGLTNGETLFGSPAYMPPEQLRSAHDVDSRGDLWSLGATLFELLGGRPPFCAKTLPELCARILEARAPELMSVLRNAPAGLAAAVGRCLAKEPAARFATVAELAEALEPFAAEEGRLSVKRIVRILGAVGPSGQAQTEANHGVDVEIRRLQDATTMRSEQGVVVPAHVRGTMAGHDLARAAVALDGLRKRSVMSLGAFLAFGAGAVSLGAVAAAGALQTGSRHPAKRALAVESSESSGFGATASSATVPVNAHIDEPSSPVVGAPAPSFAAEARAASSGTARSLAKYAASPTASAPRDTEQKKTKPPQHPSPASSQTSVPTTLPGTEGFGDRK